VKCIFEQHTTLSSSCGWYPLSDEDNSGANKVLTGNVFKPLIVGLSFMPQILMLYKCCVEEKYQFVNKEFDNCNIVTDNCNVVNQSMLRFCERIKLKNKIGQVSLISVAMSWILYIVSIECEARNSYKQGTDIISLIFKPALAGHSG
jgi:hypothetical protein